MPTPPISPSCPTGFAFYICASSPNPFVGCCSVDACAASQNICPLANLASASFNNAAYGTFPDQACADPAAKFYTCTFNGQRAPFIGCCKSNPCGSDNACPVPDLVGMQLSPDPAAKQAFLSDVGFVSAGPLNAGPSQGVGTNSAAQSATGSQSAASASTGSNAAATTASSGSKLTGVMSSTSSALTIPFPITTSGTKNTLLTATSTSGAASGTSAAALVRQSVSRGTVAGITVSSIALAAGLLGIVFFLCCRQQRKNGRRLDSRDTMEVPATSDGPLRAEMAEVSLVPEAYPVVETYPEPPLTWERRRAGSISRAAGSYPSGNAFTPRESMVMGSGQNSNTNSKRNSRYYATVHDDDDANIVTLASSPPGTPSPSTRPTVSRHSAADIPPQNPRRPSIPLFYPFSHQKQPSSSSMSRHSSSANAAQLPPIRNSSVYPTSAMAPTQPPIPNRNSSIYPTSPMALNQQQTPYIITPTAISTPQSGQAYNYSQYHTTIRPVSLDPVPENDDGSSLHVSPMTMPPTMPPPVATGGASQRLWPPQQQQYQQQSAAAAAASSSSQDVMRFPVDSPTIAELDAIFGVAHTPVVGAAAAESPVVPVVRMSPHLGSGAYGAGGSSSSSMGGRSSPQRRAGGGGGGAASGRLSPLAGGRTSPLKQMTSMSQPQYQYQRQDQQLLQPQRYKRLSGVGVSRLSTGSDVSSEGKRSSMTLGGGRGDRTSWERAPQGQTQTGWYRQPGLGVGFLPG